MLAFLSQLGSDVEPAGRKHSHVRRGQHLIVRVQVPGHSLLWLIPGTVGLHLGGCDRIPAVHLILRPGSLIDVMAVTLQEDTFGLRLGRLSVTVAIL